MESSKTELDHQDKAKTHIGDVLKRVRVGFIEPLFKCFADPVVHDEEIQRSIPEV